MTVVGATFRGSSHSHSRVSHTAPVHLFRVFVCKENRNATIIPKLQRLYYLLKRLIDNSCKSVIYFSSRYRGLYDPSGIAQENFWLRLIRFRQGESAAKGDSIKALSRNWEALEKMEFSFASPDACARKRPNSVMKASPSLLIGPRQIWYCGRSWLYLDIFLDATSSTAPPTEHERSSSQVWSIHDVNNSGFQIKIRPLRHGIRVIPSGPLLSVQDRQGGSLTAEKL